MDAVYNDKERKEGIAVYIKRVEPLHGLLDVRPSDAGQMPVGNLLPDRGQDGPDADEVDQHGLDGEAQDRRQKISLRRSERHAVGNRGHEEQRRLDGREGRVVPGPMVLGLFPIIRGLVNALRLQTEEGPHLIQGRLDVHGGRLEEPTQIVGRNHGIGTGRER